jgi:hypothetical protein
MKIVLIVSALSIGAVCGHFGIAHVAAKGIRREDATGGDKTLHVHTIYRDPSNDYGVKFNGPK